MTSLRKLILPFYLKENNPYNLFVLSYNLAAKIVIRLIIYQELFSLNFKLKENSRQRAYLTRILCQNASFFLFRDDFATDYSLGKRTL